MNKEYTFEEYKKEAFEKDAELKQMYDDLEPIYQIIEELITIRDKNDLTQADLAKLVGVKQSNISRLESGNYNPSLKFLQKIAKGLGKKIEIRFV